MDNGRRLETISIVSPVYQSGASIARLVEELCTTLAGITSSYEIILVDDRSRDHSWEEIQRACRQSNRIRGVRLSRNFGQHAAITAGLSLAKGEWVVVMDCDLQDRPDQIPILYNKALEGYDIVSARRRDRKDSQLKRFTSKAFYAVFSFLTGTKQDATIANFGIYHSRVIQAVLDMGDTIRYFPAMVQWTGFNATAVDVAHCRRAEGKSSYNLPKLLRLALNISIAFSDKPLRLVAQGGLLVSALSLLIGLLCLVGYLLGAIKVPGYASVIISIWLSAGINVFVLGLVGLYVGKAFEQTKHRPTYIIAEEVSSGNLD